MAVSYVCNKQKYLQIKVLVNLTDKHKVLVEYRVFWEEQKNDELKANRHHLLGVTIIKEFFIFDGIAPYFSPKDNLKIEGVVI